MPLLPAVMLATSTLAVQAQTYPQRPVRIIVNVSAGGGVDIVARIAGAHMGAVWGQTFVVDNRTGTGGAIGSEHYLRDARAAGEFDQGFDRAG